MFWINRQGQWLLALWLVLTLCLFFVPSTFAYTGVVIAFGDSLTEGCNVTSGSCGWVYSVGGYGYEMTLQGLLDDTGERLIVHNFGRGGETTGEGMERLDEVLRVACNQGVEYLLLLEGTNDLLHGENPRDIQFNLRVMIDKCRAKGIEPLLATITPDPQPGHEYKEIALMNEYIRALAREKGLFLVDLYAILKSEWDRFTNPRGCYGDLTHPNPTGYAEIGSLWWEGLNLLPVRTGEAVPYATGATLLGAVEQEFMEQWDRLEFQYGADCVMNNWVPVVIDTSLDDGFLSVQAQLHELFPETTYCYRLVARDARGVTLHNGRIHTFDTLPRSVPWLLLLVDH